MQPMSTSSICSGASAGSASDGSDQKRAQLKKELAYYRHRLAHSPNDVGSIIKYRDVLYELGHKENALASYEKALRLDPKDKNHKGTWMHCGYLLLKMGHRDEASECYEKVINTIDIHSREQLDHLDIMFDPRAITVALWTDDTNAEDEKARKEEIEIINENVVKVCERTLKTTPNDPPVLHAYGKALDHLGKEREATQYFENELKCYEEALKKNPHHEETWVHRAKVLNDLGHYEEAKKSVEEFLKRNLQPASFIYGHALFAMRHATSRLKTLKALKSLERSPRANAEAKERQNPQRSEIKSCSLDLNHFASYTPQTTESILSNSLSTCNPHEGTALLKAASSQSPEDFRSLLDQIGSAAINCSLNVPGQNRWTAFHWLAYRQSSSAFRTLIECARKKVINQGLVPTTNQGDTVFHLAAWKQDEAAFLALIQKASAAAINQALMTSSHNGSTGLTIAASYQSDKAFAALLAKASTQAISQTIAKVSQSGKTAFNEVLKNKSAATFSGLLGKASLQSLVSLLSNDQHFVINTSPLQLLINLGIWIEYLQTNHQPIPMTELVLESVPESINQDLLEPLFNSLGAIFQTFSKLTIRCPLTSELESIFNRVAAKSKSHCTLRILEMNPTDQKAPMAFCSAPFLNRFIEQIPNRHEQKEQKEQMQQKEDKASPLIIRLRNGVFIPGMVISHPNLQELDLSGNAISTEAIKAIEKSLASCSHLRKLVLDRIPLPQAIQSWTTLLAGIRSLEYLSCQSQQWTHESWEMFLRYLTSHSNLTHLDLHHTSLSGDQTRQLTETIRNFNLQLTECLIDSMPQELSAILQRNRQKEALEKQWQALVTTIESHQSKLSEVKESTMHMTDKELRQAEQEVAQAIQQLQAIELQRYPLPSDKRPRSSDYRSFFLHWIEAWRLAADQQHTVDKTIDYYQMAIRMQEKYAPQNKIQLKKFYFSYLQTLTQWQKSVDNPLYPIQLAIWAAEDAYQKQVLEAAIWIKDCYQRYLAILIQGISQEPQEKGALQNVYEALKFLRIVKARSPSLELNPQTNYFVQIAQALYCRPHSSLILLEEALSIAEQAEIENEHRARETLEAIHEAYINKINQLTLEAKDCETALRCSQELLSKVQETKTKKFSHRGKSLVLCQETFLRLVECFYQTDGQEETIMDLLEYIPSTTQLKARLDAVVLTCSKRYLQKRISDYLAKHCGSFSRTVSHFPEELEIFQGSLKTIKSQPELVKKVKDFLEDSQTRYSHLYWREVFNDLQAILRRIARISILDEAYEKSPSDFYVSVNPAVKASMPEPSAPLAPQSDSSSQNEKPDSKEAKETKKILEVAIPKRPKRETVRDHLDYLEQLGVTREQVSTDAEKEYGRFMMDFFSEQIMEDPVFLNDGYTYDKEKIIKWIDTKAAAKIIPTSPFKPNVTLNRNDIKPNHSMQSFIIEFLEKKIAERLKEMKKESQAKLMEKQQSELIAYLSSSLSSSPPSLHGMFSFSSSSSPPSSFGDDSLSSGSSTSVSSSSSSYTTLKTASSSLLFCFSRGGQGSISLSSSPISSLSEYPEPSAPLWTESP